LKQVGQVRKSPSSPPFAAAQYNLKPITQLWLQLAVSSDFVRKLSAALPQEVIEPLAWSFAN